MVLLRFGNMSPLFDDWMILEWLEHKIATGEGSFLLAHNGQLISLYRYCLYQIATTTGYLDHILLWTLWSATLASFAALIWYCFARVVGNSPLRWILLVAIAVLFSVPFSGYRAAWVILVFYAQFSLFAWAALALVGFGKGHLSKAVGLVLAMGAALALGVGALTFLAIAVYLLVRSVLEHEQKKASLLWSGVYFLTFALFLFVVPEKGITNIDGPPIPSVGFYGDRIAPFLKCGAWPLVFAAPLGVVNYLPVAIFCLVWLFRRDFRNPSSSFVFLGFVFMLGQFAAITILRGDGGNNGMPSGRYYHMFLPWLPLVGASILLLVRTFPRWGMVGRSASWLWVCLMGGSVLFLSLFRVGGFVARESGEHTVSYHQRTLAQIVDESESGQLSKALTEKAEMSSEAVVFNVEKDLNWWLVSDTGSPHFSKRAAAGIRLRNKAEETPFIRDGFPPGTYERAPFRYWGSYGINGNQAVGGFVSEPFETEAPSLIFHLAQSKESRSQRYRYPGRRLDLVHEESGQRISVVDTLAKQFPLFLRDLPLVAVPLPYKGRYYLEASDESATQWFAFSEPLEAGRATPIALQVAGSGQLLFLAGFGLLIGLFFLDYLFSGLPQRPKAPTQVTGGSEEKNGDKEFS